MSATALRLKGTKPVRQRGHFRQQSKRGNARSHPDCRAIKIGFTSVLHTWGSAMTHHPHLHMIVPGGGISLDGTRWIGCSPNYLLPVKVLSRLFRRLMLEMLLAAHDAGRLQFFGDHARQGRVQGLSRAAASHQVVRL
jgi:hypothetical protein